VLDCRWLGIGGAGRVTELLLADLATMGRPAFVWALWGDPKFLQPFTVPGAKIIPWEGNPTRWFGQADLLRVPENDLVVYLHQIRPLRPGPSITLVHDTIPLRFGGIAPRLAKRVFYALVCRLSTRIITVSKASRDAIVRDLNIPSAGVEIVTSGVDARRIERIRTLRQSQPGSDVVVYVGRFAAHKNLRRLARAFVRTKFHGRGGRLLLVGGSKDEVAEMSKWLDQRGISGVEVQGHRSESELDELLATSRALVQPSLEEGYGLPAVEAAAIGLQVATSRTGFATEIPRGLVTFLDPEDERSIAQAIDEAASRPASVERWLPTPNLGTDIVRLVSELVA
jgi:glycosyltransferase involved in cell wall biosynthesis